MTELQQRIADFLTSYRTNMLQLATGSDGKPWICNVWYAADNDLNVYWFSANNRRHSQDIASNLQVAGSVCAPQRPGEPAIAIQFEGIAREITDDTERDWVQALYESTGVSDGTRNAKLAADPKAPHRFYCARIDYAKFFDAVSDPARSPYYEWRRN